MPTTQVPPEGTFSAYYRDVETHEWYAMLTQDQKDALNSITIHLSGWGMCACGREGRQYACTLTDSSVIGKCSRCVRGLVLRNNQILYNIYSMYEAERLLPITHFPTDDTHREECVCGQFIFQEGDNCTPDALNSIEAHTASATDETRVVHGYCAFTCTMCDVIFVKSRHIHQFTYNGRQVCADCTIILAESDDVYSCEDCGNYFDDVIYSEWRGRYLCDTCYSYDVECNECGYMCSERYMEDHECYRDNSGIYDYSYKPRPNFFGSADYYFGFELEVEDRQEWGCGIGADIVYDTLGDRVYCKHDGSLNDGFEIVSHPHSFDEIQNLNWNFLRTLRSKGFRSWDTDTCGLHVHVSRTAFRKDGKSNEAHELRFQKLIYDNSAQVCAIAGRQSSYARFLDKGNLVPKVKYGQSADRYEAINVQNDHTLEIRVFKGSLKKERILSAVEFIHSAIEYTRNMKINPKDKQFSWIRFMAYVLDNQDKYSNFVQVALSSLDKSFVPSSSHIDEENN
jgi:hypothetical protein